MEPRPTSSFSAFSTPSFYLVHGEGEYRGRACARALVRWDADDVCELSTLELLSDTLDCKVRRGARAQSNDHATPHVLIDCLVPGGLAPALALLAQAGTGAWWIQGNIRTGHHQPGPHTQRPSWRPRATFLQGGASAPPAAAAVSFQCPPGLGFWVWDLL